MSKSKKENAVGKILDATFDCFCNQGYERSSMKIIAEEAGVSRALLHFHFKSKEDLFICAINRMAATLFEIAHQRISERETSAEIIKESIEVLYELFTSDPKVTTFMVEFTAAANHSEFLREAYLDYRHAQRAMLTNLIQQVDEGALASLPSDPGLIVQIIESAILGMSMQRPFVKSKEEFRKTHDALFSLILTNNRARS